jgi:hypothetical protein
MKKIYWYYFLTIIIFLSCEKKKEQNLNEIVVEFNTTQEINTSSFIENFKIIKLSTSNETLIFQVSKVQYKNEKVFILDIPGNCIYVFNNSGELEQKLSKRGAGPEEYIQITDFYIENEILFVLDFSQQVIIEYDKNFNFINKTRLQNFGSSFVHQNNSYWFYNEPSGGLPDYQFSVLNESGEKISEVLPRNSTNHQYNWADVNVFCINGQEKYLSPRYNDTIYRITDDNNIKPEFYIDFGKHKLPDEENINDYDISDTDFFYVMKYNFYISPKYLIFDYIKDLKRYYCIYDRESNMNLSGLVNNDLINNFRFYPKWGNDNYLIEELTPDILMNDFSQSPQFKHFINISTEDDNPLIIIYKLKERTDD